MAAFTTWKVEKAAFEMGEKLRFVGGGRNSGEIGHGGRKQGWSKSGPPDLQERFVRNGDRSLAHQGLEELAAYCRVFALQNPEQSKRRLTEIDRVVSEVRLWGLRHWGHTRLGVSPPS